MYNISLATKGSSVADVLPKSVPLKERSLLYPTEYEQANKRYFAIHSKEVARAT